MMFSLLLVVIGLLSPVFCEDTALEKLVEKVKYLEKELLVTRGFEDQISRRTNTLEAEVSTIKENQVNTVVAFHVWRRDAVGVNAGARIPYNVVDTNNGGGWDSTTYEFVAPSDGVYAFYWNIHLTTSFGRYDLFKNNDLWQVARADQAHEAMADNMAVVELTAGTRMSIRAERTTTLNGTGYCTFIGFKLA